MRSEKKRLERIKEKKSEKFKSSWKSLMKRTRKHIGCVQERDGKRKREEKKQEERES